MSYVYVEYPRHLHQIGGAIKVVTTDDEKDEALAAGWSLTPHVDGAADPEKADAVPVTTKRGRPARD